MLTSLGKTEFLTLSPGNAVCFLVPTLILYTPLDI